MPETRTVLATAGLLLPLALGLTPASPAPGPPLGAPPSVSSSTARGPAPAPAAAPTGRETDTSTIRLAPGAFDPLVRVPDVPAGLRAADPRHWLVQVHAPASGPAREALSAAGAVVLTYLPEATYLVAADTRVAAALASLPAVRWIGPYQPAYKLSPALTGFHGGEVEVWAERDTAPARLAGELAQVAGVARARPAGARLVVVTADGAGALAGIARLEGVEWVGLRPRYQLANANALWVSDTGVRGVLGAAAPGRLDGAGQVAAVADSGVNYAPVDDHPAQRAFADCPAGGPCLPADYTQAHPGSTPADLKTVASTGAHHRKMAAYLGVGGDPLPRSADEAWHGTHVAGSIAADYPDAAGAYGTRSRESDGIAPAARLAFQDIEAGGQLDLPDDPYDLFGEVYDLNGNRAYDPAEDARVHNNSYGESPGIDAKAHAARVDDFVVDHPDFVAVFAGGNDGPGAATLPGGEALAKNALTSCASENGGQPFAAPDTAASFSSHGPTPDGRIKPDLCTPGQVLVSPKGGTADEDHYLQGTSMSAPILSGLAVLVRQYVWDGFGPAGGIGYASGRRDASRRHNPSAALVKAVLVNSAQRMRGFATGDRGDDRAEDGMWPSAGQGFGRVELDKALYFGDTPGPGALSFPGERRTLFVADQAGGKNTPGALDTGGMAEFPLDVAPGEPLVISLAWTDPSSGLATGTPRLVNDLDLEVTDPHGTVFYGNEFNTQSPLLGRPGDPGAEVAQSVPGGTPDRQNNVEAFRLADPPAGRYTVRVRGAGVGLGPQGFALAASARLATNTPRIFFDVAKARPGTPTGAWLLGTPLSGEAIDGFAKLGPSVYRAGVTVPPGGATVRAAGVEATLPADSLPPAVSGVEVDPVSSDLTRIRWSTDEPSTGAVVLESASGKRRLPDVAAVAELPGLHPKKMETKGAFLDRPVLTTRHEVLASGLVPGAAYDYAIEGTDEAGNQAIGEKGRFTATDAIYAPDAPDIAQLHSDTGTGNPGGAPPAPGQGEGWGTSPQLYAGRLPVPPDGPVPLPPVEVGPGDPVGGPRPTTLMPAFLFRLPDGLDLRRVTGASVQLFSGHDLVADSDHPAYSLDLLSSGVEAKWGPGTTYETVRQAPADVHLVPEPTLHRGGNVAYTFAVACNDLAALQANLAGDPAGGRALAFRLQALSSAESSALSFESGFGPRSRGPQLRPRLLLHLDGADPLPCTGGPAPAITDVLVDHVDERAAVVSWRTDVLSDSTVYFREAGTGEWIPVGSPLRVTQHFVRVGNLKPLGAYEFVVRSANCAGEATVDDNRGSAYALFPEAYQAPVVSGLFAEPAAGGARVGWTTDQPSTSVVRYGLVPDALDHVAAPPGPVKDHLVPFPAVAPCRIHYFVVESTNQSGKTTRSEVLAVLPPGSDPLPVASFDFGSGDQGFAPHPPDGSGGLSAPAPAAIGPGSGTAGGAPLDPTRWQRRPEPVFSGSQAMRTVLRDAVPGYSSGADLRLVSPPVLLPPGPGVLRFQEWFELAGTASFARVELSPDDGATWVPLRADDGASPESKGFPRPATTVLPIDPALTGRPVRIAFRLVSGGVGDVPLAGWAVDDVALLSPPCPPPAEAARKPVAPPSRPPAETASGQATPHGPRPPGSAGAAGIGALPPSGGQPSPASLSAGTATCGPASPHPPSPAGGPSRTAMAVEAGGLAPTGDPPRRRTSARMDRRRAG